MDTVTIHLDGATPALTGALLGVALATIADPAGWHNVAAGMPPDGRYAVFTSDGHLLPAWVWGGKWLLKASRQDYTVTHWRPWEG